MRLDRLFYSRPAREVARDLLGKRLVRMIGDKRLAGFIVETEAYCDASEPDLACHGDRANNGQPTVRTVVMFGPAGFAYVYFTYGMHWMFNVVTGRRGQANAVLIRAIEPTDGESIMSSFRPGRKRRQWTNGPAKLAKAMAIDGEFNGTDLCQPNSLIWIEDGLPIPYESICIGPRIGLGNTPEPWLSMPWRYWIRDNVFVSV